MGLKTKLVALERLGSMILVLEANSHSSTATVQLTQHPTLCLQEDWLLLPVYWFPRQFNRCEMRRMPSLVASVYVTSDFLPTHFTWSTEHSVLKTPFTTP